MAEAETLIDRFLQDQDDILNKWHRYTVNPFASAYESALDTYKATLKAQEDADKAAAERKFQLVMLAISLCGGGMLTAAFGTAALKSIAAETAVHVICRNNMERAFRAAHFVSTNKTAEFIAGKLWDEAEKSVTDAVTGPLKNRMAQDAANYTSLQSLTAARVGTVSMEKTLENFLLDAKIKNADFAREIRDNSKLAGDQKLVHLAKLKQSQFMKPPEKSVDNGTLSDDIELSFYLNLVMDSDYAVSYKSHEVSYYEGRAKMKGFTRERVHTPIDLSPTAKTYPTGETGFNQLGGEIVKRLNTLYKKTWKADFITNKIELVHLYNAERAIGQLADTNIKRLVQAAAN